MAQPSHRQKYRTDAIGKQFGRYRDSLGVYLGEGRQSEVTFHSLRHWFNTMAINAGQPPHMVSLIMGHQEGQQGMTLGRYWSGAQDEALRAVVEAVKLPNHPRREEGSGVISALRNRLNGSLAAATPAMLCDFLFRQIVEPDIHAAAMSV